MPAHDRLARQRLHRLTRERLQLRAHEGAIRATVDAFSRALRSSKYPSSASLMVMPRTASARIRSRGSTPESR